MLIVKAYRSAIELSVAEHVSRVLSAERRVSRRVGAAVSQGGSAVSGRVDQPCLACGSAVSRWADQPCLPGRISRVASGGSAVSRWADQSVGRYRGTGCCLKGPLGTCWATLACSVSLPDSMSDFLASAREIPCSFPGLCAGNIDNSKYYNGLAARRPLASAKSGDFPCKFQFTGNFSQRLARSRLPTPPSFARGRD